MNQSVVMTATLIATPSVTDTIRLTVIQLDLDHEQSLNADNAVNDLDDGLESTVPAGLAVNDDDDDPDAHPGPDNADEIINGPLDRQDMLKLTLHRIKPNNVPLGSVTLSGGAGLRIFKARDGSVVKNPEDTESLDLWSDVSARNLELLAEGVAPGVYDLTVTYRGTDNNMVATDMVKIAVVKLDLDVDSDNDNGYAAPSRSQAEDDIEDATGQYGKIVFVNKWDLDNDGVVGYYDMQDGGTQFARMVLELPAPLDLTACTLRFTYSADFPPDTALTGDLRIWTAPAVYPRNPNSIADPTWPGHFVPAGVPVTAAQAGFAGNARAFTFYVEGIRKSSAKGDQPIRVEVDHLGRAGPSFQAVCGDRVRLSVCEIKKVRLGGSERLSHFEVGKVYVPSRWGGDLTLAATGGGDLELFYHTGADTYQDQDVTKLLLDRIEADKVATGPSPLEYEVPQPRFGWYYVFREAMPSRDVSVQFVEDGKADVRPWDGWYWPTLDSRNPNLYDTHGAHRPLLKYDQAFGTRARPWEAANHSGGPAWAGHCWGWSVASILVAQPQAAAKDGIVFNRDELEGLCSELGDCGVSVEHPNSLTMFDPKTQDGSLWPPPTDALGEPADPFCARFHVCLRDGIRRRRSALQSNLRDPRGTDPEQVWNHAIYRYSSRFVNDDGDPDEVIRHETTVTYNDDLRPPPTPDGPGRTWRYVYKIRYDPTTGEIEPNWPQANWMRSGGRFAPSHLFFLRNSIWTAKNPYVRRDFLAELSIPIP